MTNREELKIYCEVIYDTCKKYGITLEELEIQETMEGTFAILEIIEILMETEDPIAELRALIKKMKGHPEVWDEQFKPMYPADQSLYCDPIDLEF